VCRVGNSNTSIERDRTGHLGFILPLVMRLLEVLRSSPYVYDVIIVPVRKNFTLIILDSHLRLLYIRPSLLRTLSPKRGPVKSKQPRPVNPKEFSTELCVLLEEYSPRWYAEKQRHRALVARRPPREVLLELVVLLEEYSPRWYTEEQRDRAFAALRAPKILEKVPG
jgi:hypothetical protein